MDGMQLLRERLVSTGNFEEDDDVSEKVEIGPHLCGSS